MAMIKCRECGKEISSRAECCPYCGFKTRYGRNETENKNSTIMVYVMIAMIVIGLIMVIVNVSTYIEDTSGWWPDYTYAAPFTDHELGVIFGFIFGAGLFGGGISGMINIKKNQG